jgi:hypothetical protein
MFWAQPEAAFRTGGIDYQLAYVDTLKRELDGTTKESEQFARTGPYRL